MENIISMAGEWIERMFPPMRSPMFSFLLHYSPLHISDFPSPTIPTSPLLSPSFPLPINNNDCLCRTCANITCYSSITLNTSYHWLWWMLGKLTDGRTDRGRQERTGWTGRTGGGEQESTCQTGGVCGQRSYGVGQGRTLLLNYVDTWWLHVWFNVFVTDDSTIALGAQIAVVFDLSPCDLMWSDVIWCDLMWSDVIWCDLMWSDVSWCDLMWSDVIWCDLMWSDVIWCDLMWSDVIWCDLMWSDVTCTVTMRRCSRMLWTNTLRQRSHYT